MAWTGVVTNVGSALLTRWADGGTLTIDKAETGTSTVLDTGLLAQTALKQKKQDASIVSTERIPEGLKINMQITAPSTGYVLNQFGIFGHIGSESDVLIALFQRQDGITIPSESESQDYVYSFYGILAITNNEKLTVKVDPEAVVTDETLQNKIDELTVFTEAVEKNNIESGETFQTIFGKIKKWFSELKKVAFSGKYTDLEGRPESIKNPHALTFTGKSKEVYDGSAAKTIDIPDTASDVGALPNTGGTINGNLTVGTGNNTLKVGNKLELRTDDEGGNIDIYAPDSAQSVVGYWEMDAFNGRLRFLAFKNGSPLFTALSLGEDAAHTSLTGNAATATKVGHVLTFSNGASGSFDGSAAKTVKIPDIQGGTVSVTPSAANTATSTKVTFPHAFAGTPTVVACPSSSAPQNISVSTEGADKNGVTIYVTRSTTTATTVRWIAVYPG